MYFPLMKPTPCWLLPLLGLCLALAPTRGAESAPATFGGATPLQWSIRLADSEMPRSLSFTTYKTRSKAKWDYTAGLFTLSLVKLGEHVNEPRYIKYAEEAMRSFINEQGNIHTFRLDEYNIDSINPGKTVLAVYGHSGDERFRKAAALLREQMATHPRTSEGGFWHKKRYPHQMWLDGLYMAAPFLAEYALRFNEPDLWNDVAKQIQLVDKYTYDEKSGLHYHGWDEKREQDWADKSTGRSPHFWSRSVGWYAMALVDTLDFIPAGHPTRPQIIEVLNKVARGIVKHQDPKSGVWYQVTDQGEREGNYLESTASAMFVYTLGKAVNHGYLSKDEYLPAIRKGYEGIIHEFIKKESDGSTSLTKCCQVAGLGYGRDGSFAYYISEPIVTNDLKGVGPFILAGVELEKLLGNTAVGWNAVPQILEQITEPKFPDTEFSIVDFGAPTNGKTECTEAIAKAIDACHKAGGGRVVVPAGIFLTGPIHLKSNVNLYLDEGAKLRFVTDPAKYPNVFTRWEGVECFNYSPLIYAYGQENIAVTGRGVLDGQADYSNWWSWVKKDAKTKQELPAQRADRNQLFKQSEAGVPVAERIYGAGHHLRPPFIQPYRCRNVLIEGVTILRSPFWEVHPVLCTNVIVRGLTVTTHGPNNDGCDPESSRYVLIEDCHFDTGDDCIAIKSGRNADGRRLLMPSENLIIRNCVMKDGHGGTVIGSEISGSCRNVFTENCTMDSPELDRALRLKTNAVRGGTIENIYFRNVEVGRVSEAIVTVDFQYEEGSRGPFLPVVRNIVVENVTSKSSPRVLSLRGFEKSPIRGVRLINCDFRGVEGPDVVEHVEGLEKIDVKLAGNS